MIAVFVIGILVAAFSPESARPQAGIAPVGKEMASAPDKPVSLTLTEAGAQTGKASVQSASQAARTVKAVSAGAGSRYTGGGVTTSSTARYPTELAVDDSGRFCSGDEEAAGSYSEDSCDGLVFWLALLILVCVAVAFMMVTVRRGKRMDPHENKNL
jgi:hypothetical protein